MIRIFRNFWYVLRRSRGASLLNVAGLSVAFAVFTAILIQVNYEYGYNGSFPKADRIYRFEIWDEEYDAYAPAPMAEMIRRSVPELQHVGITDLRGSEGSFVVRKEGRNPEFYEEKVGYADTGLVSLFDLPVTEGSAEEALAVKHRLLIPESVARKWFGQEQALGRTVLYDGASEMTVAAVYRDLPGNSTVKNLVYSWDFNKGLDVQNWNYLHFYKIAPGTDPAVLSRKITELPEFRDQYPHEIEEAAEAGVDLIQFRPLKELYFTREGGNTDGGNKAFTGLLLTTGLLILLIALVNFLNFSIALAPVRVRELNTQRTFGASVAMLRSSILSEAALFAFLSCLIGLAICWGMSRTFLQEAVSVSLDPFQHPGVCAGVVSLCLLAGIAAGIYPAFYMTSFSPALVLKGSQALSPRGVMLRNGLMVFQFVVSMVLMISVLFIGRQLGMMKNRPWGIDKEDVVYVRTNQELKRERNAFFNELRTSPAVRDLTYASAMLGREEGMESWGALLMIGGEEKDVDVRVNMVAPNFLRFFGIQLVEGEELRDTTRGLPWRGVMNETMVRKFGIEEPLGFKFWSVRIQGVVKDFNYFTLQHGIDPLMLIVNENYSDKYYYIRIDPENRQGAFDHIRNTVRRFSQMPCEVRYLDDGLQSLYEKETQLGRLIGFFGGVTILIALMGVYGLVLFNARFKAKEIGIRKVNGASSGEMVLLLNRSFLRLIGLSFVIGCPIAWYALSSWLTGFAYRTELSAWVFLLAGSILLCITVLTIGWQSWQAANRNPVEVLKNE